MDRDAIIREWFYRLPNGYANAPYSKEEMDTLHEVLRENGLNGSIFAKEEFQLDQAFHDAKPVEEAETDKSDERKDALEVLDMFQSPESFEQHILDKFAMEGQEVGNLTVIYQEILRREDPKLKKWFSEGGKQKPKSGTFPMSATSKEAYEICKSAIVVNGHYSELWFAIEYNGLVKGGVAGDSIISDVDIPPDIGVSLKDYARFSSVNFGKLPRETNVFMQKIIVLFELLTDYKTNISQTRKSLNILLDELSKPEIQKDIDEILKMADKGSVKIIENTAKKIREVLGGRTIDQLIAVFIETFNKLIQEKIQAVEWWGIIAHKTHKVYMESSDQLQRALSSDDDRLNTALSSFEAGNLRVNANKFEEMIKAKDAKAVTKGGE
jgi:hypothetical protein